MNDRHEMKKSLADVFDFLNSPIEKGSSSRITFFDRDKREHSFVSASELPIGSPMFINDSMINRISEDLVLLTDTHDERVLRLGTSATSATSASSAGLAGSVSGMGVTPADDDDDSPLLFRKDTVESALYEGEKTMFAVTQVNFAHFVAARKRKMGI